MKKVEKEYRRNRKRIQNYIRERYKKGFITEFELPKIPKKITEASVRRLEKFTPKKIREYEKRWFSRETGEIIESENHAELTKAYKAEQAEIKYNKSEEKRKADAFDRITAQFEKESRKYEKLPGEEKTVSISSVDLHRIYQQNFMSMLSELSENLQNQYGKIIEKLREEYSDKEIFDAFAEANNGEYFLTEDYYTKEQASNFLYEVMDILGYGLSLEEFEETIYMEDYADFETAYY